MTSSSKVTFCINEGLDLMRIEAYARQIPGETPLTYAVRVGNYKMVKEICAFGKVFLNIPNSGLTPFSSYKGRKFKVFYSRSTPLSIALDKLSIAAASDSESSIAKKKYLDIVNCLIHAKADINQKDPEAPSSSLLTSYMRKAKGNIVRLLLENSARPAVDDLILSLTVTILPTLWERDWVTSDPVIDLPILRRVAKARPKIDEEWSMLHSDENIICKIMKTVYESHFFFPVHKYTDSKTRQVDDITDSREDNFATFKTKIQLVCSALRVPIIKGVISKKHLLPDGQYVSPSLIAAEKQDDDTLKWLIESNAEISPEDSTKCLVLLFP